MTSPDFDAEWLQGYLSARQGCAVEVLSFERFTRGTSRQTWFASYRPSGGEPVEITLRTDHPAGSGDPTPLDQEFHVYERLGRTGLPVAAALWWEDDPRRAPRPFYVRRRIEGSWNIPGYYDPDPKFNAVRLAAAQEHMRKLAAIHRTDWRTCGFESVLPVPASREDAAPCFVRTLLSRLDPAGPEPLPMLVEFQEWLVEHAPPAPCISLCKGTNGFGEEVFRDGEIVALSDWEEVSIGDPASDLAMVQGFTEPIVQDGEVVWDLPRALDFYRRESGIEVTMENIRYYQLARLFGRAVMFAHTANVVAASPNATVRQAWTATEVLHVVKRALGASLGWFEPVSSQRFDELNESVQAARSAQ